MKSVYKKLVSFREAVNLARETIKPLVETEEISITESSGRILARSVFAPRNNPPFNRSTMDGYAVISKELDGVNETEPASLSIAGESFIGQGRKEMKCKDCCFRISTGAIIPKGADAVVKVEDTEEAGDGKVKIFVSVVSGTNIAEAGSDISEQELLVLAGKEIDTNDIAVFASLGIPVVEVYRKLSVSIISTGNELIRYDEKYREGSINDANGIAVQNELNHFRFVDVRYAGIARDDYREIKGKIEENLAHSDIVILSGGSSAGESDLVYRIIDEMNPGMIFHGVLVKPGLPTVLGKSGEKVVIGLPGFPVSSLMIFRSIFLQAILAAGGLSSLSDSVKGVLAVNLKLEMGRQNLIPVTVSPGDPMRVYPVTGLSGSISRFISTHGFISVEGNTKFLEAGTDVDITMWVQNHEDRRPIISGNVVRMTDENDVTELLSTYRYHRMNPRDSLKSLKNGDTSISTFYITSGFPIHSYVKTELGDDNFYLYSGKTVEIGILSDKPVRTIDDIFDILHRGGKLAGPAIRFLENIVSDDEVLHQLILHIRNNLSSYSMLDMRTHESIDSIDEDTLSICIGDHGITGRNTWSKAFEINPVLVVLNTKELENNLQLMSDFNSIKD